MIRYLIASVVALALISHGEACAATLLYANLTTSQETTAVNPTTSTGDPRPLSYGFATFTLNDAQTELAMSVTIYNIDVTGTQTSDTFDNLVNAHIHAAAPPGSIAGVRWGFFGTPDNHNNPDNLVVTPFLSGAGGTFTSIWNDQEGNGGTTLTAQLPNILAGLSYVNFHTVQFGGGEIRGQIYVVPEPSAGVLTSLALAGLLVFRKRF